MRWRHADLHSYAISAHTHTRVEYYFYVLNQLINKFAYEFCECRERREEKKNESTICYQSCRYNANALCNGYVQTLFECASVRVHRSSIEQYIPMLDGKSKWVCFVHTRMRLPSRSLYLYLSLFLLHCLSLSLSLLFALGSFVFVCVYMCKSRCSLRHSSGWNHVHSIFIWPMTVNTQRMMCLHLDSVLSSVHACVIPACNMHESTLLHSIEEWIQQ